MIRRLLAAGAALIAFALPIASNAQASYDGATTYSAAHIASLPRFTSPDAAQQHCPNDTVVWLNTKTGIWHLAGERWYGKTKHGAYVCEREARKAGDRETRNGQ